MAEGTIISDGQGHFKILKGNQWVDYGDPPPGQAGSGRGGQKFSPQAQAFLNDMSQKAADAQEASRIYDAAKKPLQDFQPSPMHGRLQEMMTPSEGGNILDTIGGVIGTIPRVLGAITPKEDDAFQKLKGYQSQQVLQAQLAQKGVQSESDAARMALTELSPIKSLNTNMDVVNRGEAKSKRKEAQAVFYGKWANKYGLNGTDPQGHTADQIWSQVSDYITARVHGASPQDARKFLPHTPSVGGDIKILSRQKVGPK